MSSRRSSVDGGGGGGGGGARRGRRGPGPVRSLAAMPLGRCLRRDVGRDEARPRPRLGRRRNGRRRTAARVPVRVDRARGTLGAPRDLGAPRVNVSRRKPPASAAWRLPDDSCRSTHRVEMSRAGPKARGVSAPFAEGGDGRVDARAEVRGSRIGRCRRTARLPGSVGGVDRARRRGSSTACLVSLGGGVGRAGSRIHAGCRRAAAARRVVQVRSSGQAVSMSLSPRPRQAHREDRPRGRARGRGAGRRRGRAPTRSPGMMPSVSEQQAQRLHRLVVGARGCTAARPIEASHGVLGLRRRGSPARPRSSATRWSVRPRPAAGRTSWRRAGRRAAALDRRGMARRVDAVAGRLDAVELRRSSSRNAVEQCRSRSSRRPTHAMHGVGSRRRRPSSSSCARASSLMTFWKSRTIAGKGCGPAAVPKM